jgi:predicted  nucleic acid-binding Zn-ribbon protein
LDDNIEDYEQQLKKLKDNQRRQSQKVVDEEIKLKALEKEVARLDGLVQSNLR